MFNSSLTVFYSFGFMIVKPGFFESFLFCNAKGAFVIILHDFDNVGNFTKTKMKKLFQCHELDLNNVFSVFGKRCRSYLLCSKDLNINKLFWLSRLLYLFQHLVHFLCLFEILLIIPCADCNITFIRMYFYDISINFTILLPSYIKFLINFYIFEFFSCRLLCDKNDICESE